MHKNSSTNSQIIIIKNGAKMVLIYVQWKRKFSNYHFFFKTLMTIILKMLAKQKYQTPKKY